MTNPSKGKLITLKQWDGASTAQRQKWLDEGRGLTMAAGRTLYRRVKKGEKILNPIRPRLHPYKGKRLKRKNPEKHWGKHTFKIVEKSDIGQYGYCTVCLADMQAFKSDGYKPSTIVHIRGL